MNVTTRQQELAEAAFTVVSARQEKRQHSSPEEYGSFAKSFPALIHAAGLCQAVAFAQAKGGAKQQVLEDVWNVLNSTLAIPFPSLDEFSSQIRSAPVTQYLRLSRVSLEAATWVKRYVEAIEVGKK